VDYVEMSKPLEETMKPKGIKKLHANELLPITRWISKNFNARRIGRKVIPGKITL
jgi:hypothetical protein